MLPQCPTIITGFSLPAPLSYFERENTKKMCLSSFNHGDKPITRDCCSSHRSPTQFTNFVRNLSGTSGLDPKSLSRTKVIVGIELSSSTGYIIR